MVKKGRVKGTTYHLVQPSYAAQQAGASAEAVWVSEADYRRNQRGRGDDGGDYDNTYFGETSSAVAELDGLDDAALARLAGMADADDAQYSDWSSIDEEGDENKIADRGLVASTSARAATDSNQLSKGHEIEEADKLFDDEVECEVTDDFIRQLVFGDGTADAAGDRGGETDGGGVPDTATTAEEAGVDSEAWALLTDAEKAALRVSARGDRSGQRQAMPKSPHDGDSSVDDAAATQAGHGAAESRALEAQFARAMREFDADERINDAYTDDPRTHGPLAMEQYVTALEEFVAGRAGIDFSTAEPAKNKGLINQLKLLAHRAGVFDTDGKGGVFLTTVPSEREARFAAAFRQTTERLREAARQRVQLAAREAAACQAHRTTGPTDVLGSNEERSGKEGRGTAEVVDKCDGSDDAASDDFVVLEVKTKADRLDCETAVSAYSTYFNQPNVIKAPTRARRAGATKLPDSARETVDDRSADDVTRRGGGSASLPLTRARGETADEKRLRQQAAKAAQRARRQEKSMLKKAYKTVQAEEVRREATAQADRATMHYI